jgi:hypothetical protein
MNLERRRIGIAATALLCVLAALAWFETRSVVLSISSRSNAPLTNVVIVVTGSTYHIGDIPAKSQKRVLVRPAADLKITVDYHDVRAVLDTTFLRTWRTVGPTSSTVTSLSAVEIGLRRPFFVP